MAVRVLWRILNRSAKSDGGPWLTLTSDQVRPGGSGHINRSRVNQDLFYINPSLSLEAAEQRTFLILSKVYKERSFHRELVSPDFLVPVTPSLSATEAPLSVSVVWPINNIDPWKLQPAAPAAVGGMQHSLQWARCLDLCSIHCMRRRRVHPAGCIAADIWGRQPICRYCMQNAANSPLHASGTGAVGLSLHFTKRFLRTFDI